MAANTPSIVIWKRSLATAFSLDSSIVLNAENG